MGNETIGEIAPSITPKKVVDRSAAYPNILISAAFEFSREVAKNFPKDATVITRDDIGAIHKSTAAGVQREVSTCAQYGLFLKVEGGYQVSPLLREILFVKDEKTRRRTILTCLKNPKLYKDLIEKFDGHVLPTELDYHLVRDHAISQKASPEAARVFIDNAKYAGALKETGILGVAEVEKQLGDGSIQFAEVITEEQPPPIQNGKDVINIDPPKRNNEQSLLPPAIEANQERSVIRLSGKNYATLIYPENINKKDLLIIRKELDVIEFRISDEE